MNFNNQNIHEDISTKQVSRKFLFDNYDNGEKETTVKENVENVKRLFEKLEREFEIVNMGENEADSKPPNENEQVFRLFSKEPTKISLESKDIKTYNEQVQIMRENIEKIRNGQRDEEKRLKEIQASVITSEQIIKESKIPWERNFVLHKVINVHEKEFEKKKSKRRKSKKRRDSNKKKGLKPPIKLKRKRIV
ncbi:hypothetical protein Glove_688g23 [Diversispora epigaea]|uniref:Uncharacterized protein n=1 Tax=Diversispora epigaea TaxID=1348612 RepID=A0A397G541_9GLOM|nr:hypothetical protein Glove_688g23 [Diversispora epigaea]